ncbi:CGNR zinc finger domain-containing protein [Plantactinospora sp. WMMB334]|uniref:CGNR zinc finger domain-containing protein n=1 Tax=Plantactinospora sp. WMMB334 TaxID=3404119 RepID=UPI003B933A2A
METADDVTRMRIVGGSLALDYVNTRSGPPVGPPDDDILHRYDDLVAWAGWIGVLDQAEMAALRRQAAEQPARARAAYRRALEVRELLDGLFRAAAEGGQPAAADLTRLRDGAAEAYAHARFVPGVAGFRWSWPGQAELAGPLWPIVHAAVELLTTGPLDRIKACGGCRFLFVDESKNRSRRWCSMEDCGTAAKIRRYVARRAATRAGAGH